MCEESQTRNSHRVKLANYYDLLLLCSIWIDINAAYTFINFAQFAPFFLREKEMIKRKKRCNCPFGQRKYEKD